MNRVDDVIRQLAEFGKCKGRAFAPVCAEAAELMDAQQRRIEDLEERVAIMIEGRGTQAAVEDALDEIRM